MAVKRRALGTRCRAQPGDQDGAGGAAHGGRGGPATPRGERRRGEGDGTRYLLVVARQDALHRLCAAAPLHGLQHRAQLRGRLRARLHARRSRPAPPRPAPPAAAAPRPRAPRPLTCRRSPRKPLGLAGSGRTPLAGAARGAHPEPSYWLPYRRRPLRSEDSISQHAEQRGAPGFAAAGHDGCCSPCPQRGGRLLGGAAVRARGTPGGVGRCPAHPPELCPIVRSLRPALYTPCLPQGEGLPQPGLAAFSEAFFALLPRAESVCVP